MSDQLLREIVRAELEERLAGKTTPREIREEAIGVFRRFANAVVPPDIEVVVTYGDEPSSIRARFRQRK